MREIFIRPILLGAALLLTPAAIFGAEKPPRPVAAAAVSTAPVTLGGETVLVLRSRLLSLSAEERAQRVSQRIKRLAADAATDPAAIKVVEEDAVSDIAIGDFVIMSVTDNDAALAGVTRAALAKENADMIRSAVATYKRTYNLKSLAIGLLFAVLVTLAFVFLLKMISAAYAKADKKFDEWAPSRIKGVKLQQVELLPAARITEFLSWLLGALRVAVVLLLIYIYLPIVFSFFPWTKGLADKLFGYVLHPLTSLLKAVLGYIPNLIFVAITLFCVHYFLRMVAVVVREIKAGRITFPGFYPDWAQPTFQIVRFIVWAFSLVIIFPYLPGSDSPAFKGVSVFLGVLFSLGSTSAIANAVAGIILTYMRPFKLGDRVKIVDTVGEVIEKGLLVTRVKTIKNLYVTIPNAMVLGSHIVNYSSLSEEKGIILNTTVTIGYDVPWKKVHELLISAASSAENVMQDPKPFVLQTALNDYNVAYELNAYTDAPESMAKTYSDIHANIQDRFAEAGVEILSPAFAALRDANGPVLPNAPADGRKPGFRLSPPAA